MAFTPPGKFGGGLYRPLAEINVTPLVDVMLVLLIIFMVTAPMLATGLKVDLPQAKQAQPLDPKKPVVITVAKDGRFSLGGDEITKDQLIDAVRAEIGDDNSRVIHLRGDKQASYGDVVAIMDLLAANGLTHIAIVADARAKADVVQAQPPREEPASIEPVPASSTQAAPAPAAPAPASAAETNGAAAGPR